MRILLDTNVLIDVLARRQPFYVHSAAVWAQAELGILTGLISAVSVTNIFYIVRKIRDTDTARSALTLLRDTFSIVGCDEQVIGQAIDTPLADFEDAVQYVCALHAQADCLVTRNPGHFTMPDLLIATPAEFIASQPEGP